jgi:hypothetical protein
MNVKANLVDIVDIVDIVDDSIIKTLFDGFDIEREGKIHINQLSSLLNKLRKPKGKDSHHILRTLSYSRYHRGNIGDHFQGISRCR